MTGTEEPYTHLRVGELAAIHSAITTLSVDVGRLSEKLTALDTKVVHHTQEEHKEFKETLSIVADMQKQITSIQVILSQQKGAWFALAKVAAVVIGTATLLSLLLGWIPKK